MALEDFLVQRAKITTEAPEGVSVPQDALGGADRSQEWIVVANDVPCLVRPLAKSVFKEASGDDRRGSVINARIYFARDPIQSGLSARHRIVVDDDTYAVQGTGVDPNSMGRIFQVSGERIIDG